MNIGQGVQESYGRSQFALSPTKLQEWSALNPILTWRAWGIVWIEILILVWVGIQLIDRLLLWPLLLPLSFLIAGRQGALLQLVHEAGHRLVSKNEKINDFFGYWLSALPIGVNYYGYSSGHRMHHAHAGTPFDPPSDTEKYRIVSTKDRGLYFLFLKDILGITALSVLLAYESGSSQSQKKVGSGVSPLRHLLQLCLLQAVMLATLFQMRVEAYLALWLFPAMCAHMVLMRVRGIAEHGLSKQLHVSVSSVAEGSFFTRSFLTKKNSYPSRYLILLEKALIGSIGVHYHHEHHLFPNVPFYNLKKVHEAISDKVSALNPYVYAKGYFEAAFIGPQEKGKV